jgi:opacity protein-like surface antigen
MIDGGPWCAWPLGVRVIRKNGAAIAAVCLLVLIAAPAWGEEPTSKPDRAQGDFREGTWTLSLSQAAGAGDNVYPVTTTFGVGYFLNDHFSVNFELPYYYMFEKGDDANAVGFNLLLRDHFWQRDRCTLYWDVAGGLLEADRRVPTGGTDYNWTFRAGLGATYRLRENLHAFAGLRYFHLSNGRLEGVDRNPDFNVVEGYIGLMFLLK